MVPTVRPPRGICRVLLQQSRLFFITCYLAASLCSRYFTLTDLLIPHNKSHEEGHSGTERVSHLLKHWS